LFKGILSIFLLKDKDLYNKKIKMLSDLLAAEAFKRDIEVLGFFDKETKLFEIESVNLLGYPTQYY
jgi:hypothetical protein